MIGEYDYKNPPEHSHFLRDVAGVAFVAGAATRPRGTAMVFFIIGLLFFVVGLIGGLSDTSWWVLWFITAFCWGLALLARVIGWTAGVALDTTQDVIHDRYDRHHDQTDYKFDPYTGQPLHRQRFSRWRDAEGNLLPPD